MSSNLSVYTLGTYEQGTRQCSVARLFELCQALDVYAHDVLAQVHARTAVLDGAGQFHLDLERAAHDSRTELLPLRRWARERLGHADRRPGGPHVVVLNLAALTGMAGLCGMSTEEFLRRLHELGDGEFADPAAASG
jgi:hypothetical protein